MFYRRNIDLRVISIPNPFVIQDLLYRKAVLTKNGKVFHYLQRNWKYYLPLTFLALLGILVFGEDFSQQSNRAMCLFQTCIQILTWTWMMIYESEPLRLHLLVYINKHCTLVMCINDLTKCMFFLFVHVFTIF